MSENLPKGSRRVQMRVGHLERGEVLEILQNAYTAGQIGHEEFEDRRQFCLRARYVDDLSGLISDLPGSDKWRKEEPADSPPERIIVADEVSPYSEVMVLKRGTVRMSPSMSTIRSLVVMGSSTIHIEDIMAPGVVIELSLKSVLGTIILYVPWRVQIINQSLNILSAIDIESEADGDGANGAVIINGWHIMGTFNIRVEEYLKKEKEERRKSRAMNSYRRRRTWRL